MPVANTEVAVLIVGAGPVGLTARALLERWGVRVLLVEKHAGLSPFPRARLVNMRSMEIYRQLGLAAKITGNAFAPEYGRIRFRDTLHDRDFATAAMVGVNAPVPESPVVGVVTSQDRLEPTLLAAADAHVRFGGELIGLTEETDSVVASLVDHQHGGKTSVRARYVLAADGANSTVRQLLGISTTGPGAMGGFTTVLFDADLNRWCARQPAGVYFTAHGLFAPLYPERGWAWSLPTPEDAAHADWPELLSRALGPSTDLRADALRVEHWVMNAFVAERFRHGRILLAGDAAHAIPIIGGLGMNTGIADAHNLCWKLAGVLHGWAEPSLLETYEAERLPVAHQTLRQAVANTRLMLQAQNRRREQRQLGDTTPAHVEPPLVGPVLRPARSRARRHLPLRRRPHRRPTRAIRHDHGLCPHRRTRPSHATPVAHTQPIDARRLGRMVHLARPGPHALGTTHPRTMAAADRDPSRRTHRSLRSPPGWSVAHPA